MSDPPSRILRRGRHGRVRAGLALVTRLGARERGANEFQRFRLQALIANGAELAKCIEIDQPEGVPVHLYIRANFVVTAGPKNWDLRNPLVLLDELTHNSL